MASTLQSIHQRLVQEAVDNYTSQGYYVDVFPPDNELPDFLKGFHPDMIVRLPDGTQVVVQVKSSGDGRNAEQWQQIKNAVEAHPGWRLDLVLNSRREQELVASVQPLFSIEDIEAHLLTGKQLAEQGWLNASLLITWSALEAILHRISQQKKIELPNQASAVLITKLVSEGPLSREDYEALMKILPVRNQAAHGRQSEILNLALVEQLHAIASRLLRQRLKRRRATRANSKTHVASV